MSPENERLRILEMIESGEVTPDEGARLLSGLPDKSREAGSEENEGLRILEMIENGEIDVEEATRRLQGEGPEPLPFDEESLHSGGKSSLGGSPAPPSEAFPPETARWRRWWTIPFWFGVGITVLAGIGMNAAFQSSGLGIWFYCSWLPLLLGVGLMALAWSSRTSPWLHLRVKQQEGERPERVAFSFPLPVGLSSWFLRNFGHRVPQLNETAIDEIILALQTQSESGAPLYIEVEDEEDGERVQVFIG